MAENSSSDALGITIAEALKQFFRMLVFVLFMCPFNFWRKSAERLVNASRGWSWTNLSSSKHWPFLSFLKAVLFNFFFDGVIFISYFIGVLIAAFSLFYEWLSQYGSFETGIASFFGVLVSTYYFPMLISPIRDLVYISIMPFAKFLSWCSRPAQYLEIDMNKVKKED